MTSHSYSLWVDILLDRLGVTRADVEAGRVRDGWLLIPPEGKELSPEDIRGLYKDVSSWLLARFNSSSPLQSLRLRLELLEGIETLPLVYAMRLIAFEHANTNRYWPPFLQYLLGSRVDIGLSGGMAPLFTDQWLKLYEYSGGKLYHPREGKVNIKWPISHAGLLPEDKLLVDLFGLDLKAEIAGGIHSALEGDVDDFQAELLQWLYSNGHGASQLVARLSHKERGLTIAALAQHLLWDRWDRLEAPSQGGRNARHRSIRSRLRYNSTLERLELVLDGAEWPESVRSVSVSFDGEPRGWPLILEPDKRLRRGDRLVFPIKCPVWPRSVLIESDAHQTQKVMLFESPFQDGKGGALLFSPEDGSRTRSWRPEEAYYMLAPESVDKQEWVSTLFDSIQRMGTPSGEWQGYNLFWVRACGLIGKKVSIQELERTNRMLEEANAALSLPGLSELLRPRIRPIAGMQLPAEGSEPVFAVTHTPAFEVHGLWTEPLTCFLDRWNEVVGAFENIDQALIPVPTEPPTVVLPFSETMPSIGRYRLRLLDTTVSFVIASEPDGAPRHALSLGFWIEGEDAGLVHPAMEIASGRFRLAAWSGACASLHISTDGNRQTHSLTLDSTGSCEFVLSDLVENLHRAKEVSCHVTCGSASSEEHRFLSSPSVTECRSFQRRDGIQVVGKVVNAGTRTQARIWVLEEEGWLESARPIRSQLVTLAPDGSLDGSIASVTRLARWVVVGDPDSTDSPPWGITRIEPESQGAPLTPWRFAMLDDQWQNWGPVADWLSRYHINCRDLRRAVQFSQAARLYRQARISASRVIPSIRAISPGLMAELPALLGTSAPPLVVLIPHGVELPKPLRLASNSLDVSRLPGLLLESDTAAAFLTGDFAPGGLSVTCTSGDRSITGHLFRNTTGNGRLVLQERGWVCRNCGCILTQTNPSHGHVNNPLFGQSCNRFFPIDSELLLRPAIVWYPDQLLKSLAALVDGIFQQADSKGLTEEFYSWIAAAPFQGSDITVEKFRRICNLCATLVDFATKPVAGGEDDRLEKYSSLMVEEREVVEYILRKLADWADDEEAAR